jgi:hypothetical protein
MPLSSPTFLKFYESELYKKWSKTKESREDSAFNLTPRYIDDVLPINNTNFANWIPLIEISR